MSTNRSVWQDKPSVPGVIREDPIPELEDEQLLVKVHAWAINPCDAILQDKSLPFVKYPLILGQDITGTVKDGYVTLNYALATKIPNSLSFNDASAFPLCVTTSSVAPFGKDYLALPLPILNPTSTDKSVLIRGGSSAVGSNAIQLAKAAGFEIVTTYSPRSFDYTKSLGANKVFDYNSPSVTDDVAVELKERTCVGIHLAAGKVADACHVSHQSTQKLFVASSNPVILGDAPEGVETKMTFGADDADAFKEIFLLPLANS